jgi:hypothetical protein
VTDRGRWARRAHLLVCRHAGLELPKKTPWLGRIGSSVRNGSFAPGSWQAKRARLSCLLHLGSAPSVRQAKCCRTAGCERGRYLAGCHAAPRENRLLRLQGGTLPEEYGIGLSACAGREVGLKESDCKTVKHLSTQIFRKTGESNFISNGTPGCMRSRRQRSPTVRMVG